MEKPVETNPAPPRSFLDALRKVIGLPQLEPDESGCCQLEIDDKFVVHIGYDPRNANIVLYAVAAVLPDESPAIWRAILIANRFWNGTGGATFSLDDTGRQIYLAYQCPVDIATREIEPLLEWFVGMTESWSNRLLDFRLEPPGEPGNDEPPPFAIRV
jgi:hypothetical protein